MESIEYWKVKRKRTFIGFCFISASLGTEYSIIIPNLLYYLETIIKAKYPKLMFGLIVSVYYLSALISGVTITRYVDRTRRIKQTIMVLCIFGVIGNCLYIIPLSSLFPLFGRLIQGIGAVCMSIMVGEVSRVYTTEDVVSKLSTMTICFYSTFTISPAANVPFKSVNISIGKLTITDATFASMLVGITWIICLIITWKCISNLSLEYDLKTETQMQSTSKEDTCDIISLPVECGFEFNLKMVNKEEKGPSTECIDKLKTKITYGTFVDNTVILYTDEALSIKELLSNFEFNIILLLCFVLGYCSIAVFDISLPVVATTYYHFSMQIVGILFCLTGVSFVITMFIIKRLARIFNIYYLILLGTLAFVLSIQCLSIAVMVKNRTFGTIMLASYVILLGIGWSIEQLLLGTLLTRLIPSNTQSFAEGIRRSSTNVGCLISGIITPLVLNNVIVMYYVIQLILVICLVLTLYRRRQMLYPTMIQHLQK